LFGIAAALCLLLLVVMRDRAPDSESGSRLAPEPQDVISESAPRLIFKHGPAPPNSRKQ
jgi:hypothetical protein